MNYLEYRWNKSVFFSQKQTGNSKWLFSCVVQPGTIFSYFVCGKKVNQELIDDIHILLQNAFFQLLLHVSKSQLFFPNLILIVLIYSIWQKLKSILIQKLFWPFTVWINCSSDLKNFANSWPSASNSKSFSQSLEQFILAVGQNDFVNKIPLFFLCFCVQTACFEIWLNCI